MDSPLTTVTPQINEIRAHDGIYSTHYGSPRIAHEHRVYEDILLLPVWADIVDRAVHCIASELLIGAMYSFVSLQEVVKVLTSLISCNMLPQAIWYWKT
jgi:hypothetical protein